VRRNCCACFKTSPGMGKARQSHLRPLIAASLAASRRMSAMEKQNATRDRVWPRNYSCWIRAPEPVELPSKATEMTRKEEHMKNIARHWEERFDDVMSDGRKGQYKQRLEWFLFNLHSAVQNVEVLSDGSRLLIFEDGSVYGEESELDALLALARRRKSKAKQERCRKGRGDATPRAQLRG
jgi:hypothetical protein